MNENESSFRAHKNYKQFTGIPNCLIRSNLGNSAFRLICYLSRHSDSCKVYKKKIMEDLSWGRVMLDGAIKELVQRKYLIVREETREFGKSSNKNYEFDVFPIEEIED